MMIKKSILLTVVFFLGSSLLLSQSLVEAAKKEKERRAQLKKKSTVIVTNANLYKTDREATVRITPPEDETQGVQRATPQKAQGTTPSKPSSPQKRQPSQQIDNIDQMDLSVDKVEQLDQVEAGGYRGDFATQILSSSELVRNPEFALDKPDGNYAEMPIMGFIELEVSVKNGPGDDIAIYALYAGAQDVPPSGEEEGGIPELSVTLGYFEGFWYGILGRKETGDWVAIGKGTGNNSPEKFDLGDLHSVNKVRIMFKPPGTADLSYKLETWQSSEFFFGIDAVQSLHR